MRKVETTSVDNKNSGCAIDEKNDVLSLASRSTERRKVSFGLQESKTKTAKPAVNKNMLLVAIG